MAATKKQSRVAVVFGFHDRILELQKHPDPLVQNIGYALAHMETDLDQLSSAVMAARLHEVNIPSEVPSIMEGFRKQFTQTKAVCGKITKT